MKRCIALIGAALMPSLGMAQQMFPKMQQQTYGNGNFVNVLTQSATAILNQVASIDGAILTVQNSDMTAGQFYLPHWGANAVYDNIRSVVDLKPSATVQIQSAISGYVYNEAPFIVASPSYPAGVAVLGFGVGAATGSTTWVTNFTWNDSPTNATGGSFASTGILQENDCTVFNSGSGCQGSTFILAGNAQPSFAVAMQISAIGTGKWTLPLAINDGSVSATGKAAVIGSIGVSSGTNIYSAPIVFDIFDSVSVEHGIAIQAMPYGTTSAFRFYDLSGTIPNYVYIGTSITANGAVIGTDGSTNVDLVLAPKGNGSVRITGYLGLYNSATWVAPASCGSLAGSTKCIFVYDPNGNPMYIPAYGTY